MKSTLLARIVAVSILILILIIIVTTINAKPDKVDIKPTYRYEALEIKETIEPLIIEVFVAELDSECEYDLVEEDIFMYTSCELNVRKDPSINKSPYTTLDERTKVEVVENRDDGWTSINLDNDIYFVKTKYLINEESYQELITPHISDEVPLSEDLQIYLWEECLKYNIKYCFALAVIQRESQFNSKAIHHNSNGSIDRGLCQINSCHIDKFKNLGYITSEDDLFDPYISIKCGMYELSRCVAKFGNCERAYCMYNTGRTTINSNKSSKVVMKYWSEWKSILGDY